MFKNSIKVVFLGIVGFLFLVFLTAPENSKVDLKSELNIKNVPKYLDIVSKNEPKKSKVILKDIDYIIVLNHDSLAFFKDLYKYTDKKILLIANISKTPWLIKKLAVDNELEKLYENSKISLVNDSSGEFSSFLRLRDNSQNSYFIYKVTNGYIKQISKAYVRKGALKDGVSKNELKSTLEKVVKSME